MGLDITAYATVELVEAIQSKDVDWSTREEREDERYMWEGPAVDRMAPLVPGFYKVGPEQMWFNAGSCGGYNLWRSALAKLAGLSQEDEAWRTPGAFSELVYFADNEGVIGSNASKKLAADFSEWRQRADEFASKMPDTGERDYFMRQYGNWERAFNIAADRGAVRFH